MAQCSAAGDLCIWGGSAAGGAQDDIMAWQGEFWQAFSPQNRPSARYAYRIAYDPVRQALILFGGYDGVNSLGDTWEWDGQTWTQLHPALSPPPRHAHAMAYDPVNHVILLFGG
ncbi:MAG: hypothetical protein D6711_18900 [Chloroflexi bacterium]|nr:MAG: hypothetical protein D6711_18900 [Chloroflexota bacterium]